MGTTTALGVGPEPPNGLLQVLQPVGERGALGKKRGLAVLRLLGAGGLADAGSVPWATETTEAEVRKLRRGAETRKGRVSPNGGQ